MTNENTMKEMVANGESEMMTINKEDLVSKDAMSMLTNPSNDFLCTIQDDGTRETKVKIYNAINSAEKSLADMLGKTIELVDVVAHPVQLIDEETGEMVDTIRTVLIDKNGVAYTAVSGGVTNSLQKLFMIFGMPTWDEPVKVEVKQVKTRNGNNKVNTLVAVL